MPSEIKTSKPGNIRRNANILSLLTYTYTFPLLLKGYKDDLQECDITQILDSLSSEKLGDTLEKFWLKEKSRNKPSLNRALWRAFGYEYLLATILLSIEVALRTSTPFFLFYLIALHEQGGKDSLQQVYMYLGIITVTIFISTVLRHAQYHIVILCGQKWKIACCSLVYRKIVKLNKSVYGGISIGHVANLVSNDVARMGDTSLFTALIVGPAQIIATLYILYETIGIESVAGIFIMILLIPFQIFIGKKASDYRQRTAIKTDQRIGLTNELIVGIQVIKMYVWEKPLSKLIAAVRRLEAKQMCNTSYLAGVVTSMALVSKLSGFVSILVYAATGNMITAQNAYFIITLHANLRDIASFSLSRAIAVVGETRIAANRLTDFLMSEELHEYNRETETPRNQLDFGTANRLSGIEISKASAKWCARASSNTLHEISISINSSELVAVIGPVGSGKTSILQVILKELPLLQGNAQLYGTVSYASQEPWIFDGTLQENILFGQVLDMKRYQEVIRACALEQDIKIFPYGDQTLVGDRGVMLSGGQRARVNLARAVYVDVDIYLLDDPLSAVDTQVGKQIFEQCITRFLESKCRVFVTHQLCYMENVDRIILIENGKISLIGTYQELEKSELHFTNILKEINNSASEKDTEMIEDSATFKKSQSIEAKDKFKEHQQLGKLEAKSYFSYIKNGGSLCSAVFILIVFICTQMSISGADYFIAYWIQQAKFEAEDVPNLFERISKTTLIYTFSGILACFILFTLIQIYTFVGYTTHASVVLHNKMFLAIINAPMRFFNTNPPGRIINRFAKDVGVVDELVPIYMLDYIRTGFLILGIIVVASLTNVWSLLITVIFIPVFYAWRHVCQRTYLPLKRLSAITRSPVISKISATIQGITTIRALRVEKFLFAEFYQHLDLNSSAETMYVECTRAFGFYTDILCLIYLAIVMFSAAASTEDTGKFGLVITQVLALNSMVQWWMRQWGELENDMTSVERVLEYCDVKGEESADSKTPPESWPEYGNITFKSASMKYSPSDPYVLKNLNLQINSKDKIGIVGRTGAGKSSLIWALLQLTPTEGGIFIDGLDVTTIPLSVLRSKISIIPQQPVLFSGTLRKNLDPFDLYPDEDLWNVLNEVQLKNVISDLKCGLFFEICEGGSNFSTGQKQLLCLARAIISKRKILILDEATANVDHITDFLIQKTIRCKLQDCTVLTIAHRLNSIMDSDKVLVMDEGAAMEFDNPRILLQNKSGIFYAMAEKAGLAGSPPNVPENKVGPE